MCKWVIWCCIGVWVSNQSDLFKNQRNQKEIHKPNSTIKGKCQLLYINPWSFHGQVDSMDHKLSATKIGLSHWSTDQSTHLWLAAKSQKNLWAVLSACPWIYCHHYITWNLFRPERCLSQGQMVLSNSVLEWLKTKHQFLSSPYHCPMDGP